MRPEQLNGDPRNQGGPRGPSPPKALIPCVDLLTFAGNTGFKVQRQSGRRRSRNMCGQNQLEPPSRPEGITLSDAPYHVSDTGRIPSHIWPVCSHAHRTHSLRAPGSPTPISSDSVVPNSLLLPGGRAGPECSNRKASTR